MKKKMCNIEILSFAFAGLSRVHGQARSQRSELSVTKSSASKSLGTIPVYDDHVIAYATSGTDIGNVVYHRVIVVC